MMLDHWPIEPRPVLSDVTVRWWKNFSDSGGLGLTDEGYEYLLDQLELPVWIFEFPTDKKTNSRLLIDLDRYCPCVYWIKITTKRTTLALFDSREAVSYTLFNDIARYVELLRHTSQTPD